MEDEQFVQSDDGDRLDLIGHVRAVEHHVEEIGAITQVCPGVYQGVADVLFVGKGGYRPNL